MSTSTRVSVQGAVSPPIPLRALASPPASGPLPAPSPHPSLASTHHPPHGLIPVPAEFSRLTSVSANSSSAPAPAPAPTSGRINAPRQPRVPWSSPGPSNGSAPSTALPLTSEVASSSTTAFSVQHHLWPKVVEALPNLIFALAAVIVAAIYGKVSERQNIQNLRAAL